MASAVRVALGNVFFVQVMKNSFGLVEVADSKIVLGREVSLVVGLVPFCL